LNIPEKNETLPQWNLTAIYPSFDSLQYRGDVALLKEKLSLLLDRLERPLSPEISAPEVLALIRSYDEAGDVAENLTAYAEALYTADTRNGQALAEINALEQAVLPLGKATVLFRSRLAEQRERILELLDSGLQPYRFFISRLLEGAAYQMEADLEDLAQDLSRSGGGAWSRLQDVISATAEGVWDPATGERKTITALRNLAHSADRSLRERAYRAELAAWKEQEIPLAAALNGVQGTSLTLDKRRGWDSLLQKSAFQSRLSEKTLKTLIEALESSLPLFRRYLKAKASHLGLETCAFYDLFAPVKAPGLGEGRWTWKEAEEFVVRGFGDFDREMGDFARRAFAGSWIDPQSRERKVGGAYCTGFPLAGESRILCNYEGSFDSVTTLAHELGHAWHHEVLRGLPRSLAVYPMTLAETASIFAETIIFEGALEKAGPGELPGLLEGSLKDSCQVIVDILSRFYFERALFERREQRELPPEELCSMMLEAQRKTYGDGLDPELLHPYMWAVKSHYYSPALAFYNYPYAFGLLFSLGLYTRAREEGSGFASVYRELLRLTGRASVEEVARSAGFTLETGTFWQQGLALIEKRVEAFEKITEETP
jgi:pepF/M3 family oligoendopeptidase